MTVTRGVCRAVGCSVASGPNAFCTAHWGALPRQTRLELHAAHRAIDWDAAVPPTPEYYELLTGAVNFLRSREGGKVRR